jgi:2-dehydropantoate 2-reductase
MRICVFGAGAVGGLIAARLIRAGADVSVAARGATLEAIRARGLTVRDRGGEWSVRPRDCGNPAELGPHDVVIVATKAHALAAAAESMRPLLRADTSVLSAVNGIPWWYFHGMPAWPHTPHLHSVDPGGTAWNALGAERALGCVVHLGASAPAAGVVSHAYGLQLVLGEPSGRRTPRLDSVAAALDAAGFKARVSDDIRTEIWKKLWYNMAINPVSLVAGAACDRISADPDLMALMAEMIGEGARVAAALGVKEPVNGAEQVKGFAAIGAFKTSMLQDLEAGRSVELDPILGSVVELARFANVDVPRLREVYALARLRAAAAGCYAPLGRNAVEAAA